MKKLNKQGVEKKSKKNKNIDIVESEQVELRLIALFSYLKEQINQNSDSLEKQLEYLANHAQYASKTTSASNCIRSAIVTYRDLCKTISVLRNFIFTNTSTNIFPRYNLVTKGIVCVRNT